MKTKSVKYSNRMVGYIQENDKEQYMFWYVDKPARKLIEYHDIAKIYLLRNLDNIPKIYKIEECEFVQSPHKHILVNKPNQEDIECLLNMGHRYIMREELEEFEKTCICCGSVNNLTEMKTTDKTGSLQITTIICDKCLKLWKGE